MTEDESTLTGTASRREILALIAATAGCLRRTDNESTGAAATTSQKNTTTITETATTSPRPTPASPIGESNRLSHQWTYNHRRGRLFVDGSDLFLTGQRLEKLSLKQGYSVWYTLDGNDTDSVAITDSALYVTGRASSGVCYRVNRSDGSVAWQQETGKSIYSGPSLSTSSVIFTARNTDTDVAGVYALAQDNGTQVWAIEEDEGGYGSLSDVRSGTAYVSSTGTPETHRIDVDAGRTTTTVEADSTAPIRTTEDAVYLTNGLDISKWPRDLSAQQWRFKFETSPRAPPVIENDAVYIGEKTKFYRIDEKTGTPVWTYSHGFDNLGEFAVGPESIWIADRETLHVIDKQSGEGRKIGRIPDTEAVTGMVVQDSMLVILSNSVNAYKITR